MDHQVVADRPAGRERLRFSMARTELHNNGVIGQHNAHEATFAGLT